MRIEDRLDKDTRRKLNRLRNFKSNKSNRSRDEELSERDIKDLMGVNRPKYYRSRGAFRQK